MNYQLNKLKGFIRKFGYFTVNEEIVPNHIDGTSLPNLMNIITRCSIEDYVRKYYPKEYPFYKTKWADEFYVKDDNYDLRIKDDLYEVKTNMKKNYITPGGTQVYEFSKAPFRWREELRAQYNKHKIKPKILIIDCNPQTFATHSMYTGREDFYKSLWDLIMISLEKYNPKEYRKMLSLNIAKARDYITNLKWKEEVVNPECYQTIQNYVDQTNDAESIQIIERFGNENFLPSGVLDEHVGRDWDKTVEDIYFDKEENRKKTGSYTRANFLMMMPFYKECRSVTLDDLKNVKDESVYELKEILEYNEKYSNEILKIKEISKTIAILKTTKVDKKFLKRICLENGLSTKIQHLKIDRVLKSLVLLQQALLKFDPNLKINVSTDGRIVYRVNKKMTKFYKKANIDVSKLQKDEKEKLKETVELGASNIMPEVEKALNDIIYDKIKIKRPNISNAFIGNKNLQEICDKLERKGKKIMESSLDGSGPAIAGRIAQLNNTLIASVPFVHKTGTSEGLSCGICPNTKINFIKSPFMKSDMSGAIKLFGVYEIHNIPKFVGIEKTIPINDNEFIVISKIYRDNTEVMETSLGNFIGGLATAEYLETLNVPMCNNIRYWSLFWKFSRDLIQMLDMSYLLDKSSMFGGTFGKRVARDKMNPLTVRDARLSTLIHDYKEKYSQFHYGIIREVRKGNFENLDVQHPYFKVKITSLEVLNAFIYLKQLYNKKDGASITFLLKKFLLDELEFEEKLRTSTFRRDRYPLKEDMTMKDFIKRVIIKSNEWVSYSYNNGICYRMWEKYCLEAIQKGKTLEQYKDEEDIDTTKLTATLVSNAFLDRFKNTKKAFKKINEEENESVVVDKVKRKIKDKKKVNTGLQSVRTIKTTEAIFLKEAELNDGMMPLKSIELASLDMMSSPKTCIVYPQYKEQTGYGKRQFFVQAIHSRNINRLIDSFMRALLEGRDDDILLESGPGPKNMKIQNHFNEIKTFMGTLKYIPSKHVTDMTKFGDTYPPEAMILALHACKNTGLMDNFTFNFCREGMEQVRNRVAILHPKIRRQLETFLNGNQEKEGPKIDELKKILSKLKANQELSLVDVNMLFLDEDYKDLLKEEKYYMVRHYGGVLGVFNVFWSVFSSMIKNFTALCMNKYTNGMKCFNSETHSDDSSDTSIFPVPKNPEMNKFNCTNFVKRFNRFEENHGKSMIVPNYISGKKYTIGLQTIDGSVYQVTQFPLSTMDKMISIIMLIAARALGQRPSEFKTSFGYVSEVLQQVTTSKGEISIPVIRYIAKVAAQSPSESFGKDLLSCMSRINDVLMNGCSEIICHELIILINIYMSFRYGIDIETRSVNNHVNFFGIYYNIPTMVLKDGLISNEGRLMSNSDYDETIRNHMKIMINSQENWSQKENNLGAPEVFKDFIISWQNQSKSREGKDRLQEAGKQLLKTIKERRPSFKKDWDEFVNLVRLTGSYKTSSSVARAAYFFDKYTDPGVVYAYKKTTVSTQIITRFGLMKRVIKNPIAKRLYETNDLIYEKFISLEKVIEIINQLCQKELIFDKIVELSYVRLRNKLRKPINTMMTFNLKLERSNIEGRPIPSYREITPEEGSGIKLKDVDAAFTFFIFNLMEEQEKLEMREILNIKMIDIEKGSIYLETIDNILKSFDLITGDRNTDMINISQHRNLITALLVDEKNVQYPKLIGNDILSRLNYNFDNGNIFKFKEGDYQVRQLPLESREFIGNNMQLSALLNAGLSFLGTSDSDVKTVEIYSNNLLLDIDLELSFPKTFVNSFRDRNLKEWSASILINMLLQNKLFKKRFKVYMDKNKDSTLVTILFDNWPAVSVQYENKWKIFLGSGMVPLGLTLKGFLERMLLFIAISFTDIRPYPSGINDLIINPLNFKKENPKSVFYELFKESGDIVMNKDYKIGECLNISNLFTRATTEGSIMGNSLEFILQNFRNKFIITPWRVRSTPSDLSMAINTVDGNTYIISKTENVVNLESLDIKKYYFHNFIDNSINEYTNDEIVRLYNIFQKYFSKFIETSDIIKFYLNLLENENLLFKNKKYKNIYDITIILSKLDYLEDIIKKNYNKINYNNWLHILTQECADINNEFKLDKEWVSPALYREIDRQGYILSEDNKYFYTSVQVFPTCEPVFDNMLRLKNSIMSKSKDIRDKEINIPLSASLNLMEYTDDRAASIIINNYRQYLWVDINFTTRNIINKCILFFLEDSLTTSNLTKIIENY